jgi:integrase
MAQVYQQKNAAKDSWTIRIFTGRNDNGKKRYVNYTVKGNKKQAEAKARELQHKHETGQAIAPSREKVADYLVRWHKIAAEPRLKSVRTKKDYIKQLERYIIPVIGNKRLSLVTPMDIQGIYAGMKQDRKLSPTTIIQAHRIFSNALKQAVRWGQLPNNPAEFVDLPSKVPPEITVLTPDEAREFLAQVAGQQHGEFLTLLLTSGLRPSEAIALRWEDLDLANSRLHVQRKATKDGGQWVYESPKTKKSRRVVDLPTHATLQLARLPRIADLIFPNVNGDPIDTRSVMHRHYLPALRAIGVEKSLRLYDLRHTHATLLLLEGIHPKVVSERLGHSSIQITLDTYSHVLPSMQRDTAEKLNEMLFERLDGGQQLAVN